MPVCPECGSHGVWKDGLRYNGGKAIQRYLCRKCGYRFSGPARAGTTFKSTRNATMARRVCATQTTRAKNLVTVEPRTENRAAGATKPHLADIKGKIVEYIWHLNKNGYKPSTIKTHSQNLKALIVAGANILDPESVKETIAKRSIDVNTKRTITNNYTTFLRFLKRTWEKPRYKHEDRPIFIPTEQELQLAINSGRKESIAFAQLLYETGCRYNEAERIEWTDIDAERCKVTIKASKGGNPRTVAVSRGLIGKLLSLPRNHPTVFPPKAPNTRRMMFHRRMKRLARAHDNPRFLKIHPHTFRHCKALREFHKTNNMQLVKKVLGHKNIMTTQRYVELYTEIYGDLQPEDYVCEVASTVQEAKKLVEAGFDYVCEINGEQLFRKVK